MNASLSAGGFRVLVVDDEPLARRHVRSILASDPDVTVVGECGNGRDAVTTITSLGPDLVLLDIQMPELDGFGVLAAVGAERMPAVVFVTAYDDYALKAFDVNALDYVLKPVERDRLLLAVARAKRKLRDAGEQLAATDHLRSLLDMIQERRSHDDRIAVKVDGKLVFLASASIDWLEAVDDYVRLHVVRTSYLVRGTMSSFVTQLPKHFLRIHRSVIVNTDRIKEVTVTSQGDYRLTLSDGVRLHSGRSYRGAVGAFLRSFAVESR